MIWGKEEAYKSIYFRGTTINRKNWINRTQTVRRISVHT